MLLQLLFLQLLLPTIYMQIMAERGHQSKCASLHQCGTGTLQKRRTSTKLRHLVKEQQEIRLNFYCNILYNVLDSFFFFSNVLGLNMKHQRLVWL